MPLPGSRVVGGTFLAECYFRGGVGGTSEAGVLSDSSNGLSGDHLKDRG